MVDRLAPFPVVSVVNIYWIYETSCFQKIMRSRNRKQLLSIPADNVTAISTRVTSLVRCNKFAEVESLLVRLPHTRAYQDNEEITRAKIALAWHNRDVQTVYKLIEVKVWLIKVPISGIYVSIIARGCSFLWKLLISIEFNSSSRKANSLTVKILLWYGIRLMFMKLKLELQCSDIAWDKGLLENI